MYIGDIYVPTVSELSSKNAQKEDYLVKGLGSKHIHAVSGEKTDANPIEIRGLLYQATGDPKTADDYAEDLMALEERSSVFNYINYGDTVGFLTNIRVSVPNNYKRANIRDYNIVGKFFPYAVYQHGLTYRGDRYDNGGEIYNYPRMFILPTNAYNVHLASAIDIIPLVPVGHIVNGVVDTVPIYRPFPVLDHSNYTTLTGALGTDAQSLDGTTIELDTTGEYVLWTKKIGIDIPRGTYKVKFRAKESSNVQDIQLDIEGSVSGVIASLKFNGPDSFQIYETAAISFTTHETVTVKVSKLNSPANTIVIDYIGFNSEFSVLVLYDTVSEYGTGEVKIYDTMVHVENPLDDPDNWKRVYSLRHKFVGDIVVSNELMSWRIDTSKTWTNTGVLKLRDIVGDKHLWPDQFGSNLPDIRIVEISPYYIEMEIKMVSSLGLVQMKVIVDPLMYRFVVHKNDGVSGFRMACTLADLAFTGWHTTFTTETTFRIATTTTTDGFFCVVPQVGYSGITYHHLLFDSFNKPTVSTYIAERKV